LTIFLCYILYNLHLHCRLELGKFRIQDLSVKQKEKAERVKNQESSKGTEKEKKKKNIIVHWFSCFSYSHLPFYHPSKHWTYIKISKFCELNTYKWCKEIVLTTYILVDKVRNKSMMIVKLTSFNNIRTNTFNFNFSL